VGGTLVTGGGDTVDFGSRAGADENDPLLRAAQVSLGALGIMSRLTIRAVPVYTLHRRNWMTHIDWVMDHFTELIHDNRHVDFYWYPRSDRAQLRTMNLPDDPPTVIPPDGRLKTEERDLGHQIITNDRDLRFDEMEYMLPLENGMQAFAVVRERIKERHRQNVGWRVLVRTVRGDNAMLSNCHGRDTMTIALLQNNTLPHEAYFTDMEPLLLDLGGRPHWGKKHSLTAEELAPMYPEWDDFQRIRRELDPDGVLMNDYLRRLLGDTEETGR
jgi:FAD/FMN-containing dehydrogenase